MRLLLHLFLLISISLSAQAQDSQNPQDIAKLNPLSGRGYMVTSDKLSPGQQVELRLELELLDGFFAYGDRFTLFFLEPEGIKQGELFIEPLVEFEDVLSKKKKMGLSKKGTIRTRIDLPPDLTSANKKIAVDVKYIACTKTFCLLPKILTIEVPIDVETSASASSNSASLEISAKIEADLPWALLIIFLMGLATSATPCVYPLIPITLAVLGTKKERSTLASFLISLSYVTGIAVTYAILGVIAAQTGQLFGSLISHPAVTITMSLLFLVMGLSLFGLFELQPPAIIRNRLSNKDTGHGPIGAFIAGMLAGVVASPCVGPVLVAILTYIAQSQNSGLGFILLFTFAMGFGTLFLLLGTFSQLSSRLPRSGAWMNKVKFALGVIMILMSVYYAWPILRKALPKQQVATKAEGVQWIKYGPGVIEEAKKAGKPIIIDFYADWCGACVEMDQLTFSVDKVIDKSKEFSMIKIDATEPFDGLNELQQQYKVFGLPTMIFINSSGQVLEDFTLTGFEDADEFAKRMDSVRNHH